MYYIYYKPNSIPFMCIASLKVINSKLFLNTYYVLTPYSTVLWFGSETAENILAP